MDEKLEQEIKKAYNHILETSDNILRNCKAFSIKILQLEDPSYAEIAEQLKDISEMIGIVVDSHQDEDDTEAFRYAVIAKEYTQIISNIAGAIRLDDNELLEKYIKELDKRPFMQLKQKDTDK